MEYIDAIFKTGDSRFKKYENFGIGNSPFQKYQDFKGEISHLKNKDKIFNIGNNKL